MSRDTAPHPAFGRAASLTGPLRGRFPLTVAEAQTWEPFIWLRALSARVLVVAVPRVECAWAAYCDAVPGQCHRDEWQAVRDHGAKLDEAVARVLFPAFDEVPYAW